jgi:hypothetical protein
VVVAALVVVCRVVSVDEGPAVVVCSVVDSTVDSAAVVFSVLVTSVGVAGSVEVVGSVEIAGSVEVSEVVTPVLGVASTSTTTVSIPIDKGAPEV